MSVVLVPREAAEETEEVELEAVVKVDAEGAPGADRVEPAEDLAATGEDDAASKIRTAASSAQAARPLAEPGNSMLEGWRPRL